MSTYLPFKNWCTFASPTFETNDAGQRIPTYAAGVEYRCGFLYLTTRNETEPLIEDEDYIEIIVGDDVSPEYNQVITNIRDRFGTVIEAGPLEIVTIRKYPGFTGKLHHYRLRTRLVRNAC